MTFFRDEVARIDKLLVEREKTYPVRDEVFMRLNLAMDRLVTHLLGPAGQFDIQVDDGVLSQIARFRESPVFVCGPGKSGTTLVSQLLDGHPNLFILPGDSKYIYLLNAFDRGDFDAIAAHWIKRLVSPTGQSPFWLLGKEESPHRHFLVYLHYFLDQTNVDILNCVLCALFSIESRDRREQIRYWVEKTPENELYAKLLQSRYPNARFINIFRDPLDNINSLKKLRAYRGNRFTSWKVAARTRLLLETAHRNQAQMGASRYHLIRYEDLLENPESIMRDVARFLEIPYEPTLLIPTQNGINASANSMFVESRVRGTIGKRGMVERWKKGLTEKEKVWVVSTLYAEAVRNSYPWDRPEVAGYRHRLYRWFGGLIARAMQIYVMLKIRFIYGKLLKGPGRPDRFPPHV